TQIALASARRFGSRNQQAIAAKVRCAVTKSLLIFDLVFPPCSHLPKAERQKELRRRQRLRAKARDKGYAPLVGRPLEWKTECWPAVDTSEAFLAWFR